MFIKKIVKTNKVANNQYVTFRLVQSYRLAGKPRHRNILELGTLPEIQENQHKALANRIEEMLREPALLFSCPDDTVERMAKLFFNKILRKFDNKSTALSFIFGQQSSLNTNPSQVGAESITKNYHEVDLNSFENTDSKSIGAEWMCKQAIDEINLSSLLSEELTIGPKKTAIAMMALVGRLIYPGSDNKTADWLNENSGSSFLFGEDDKVISRKQLSQVSDELYRNKNEIEKFLINRFRNLFNYKPSLLIYDLTNTHFEGRMQQSQKAQHGRNKQKRNDCPQITIALAIDENGFAQHSRFYEGNIAETKTLLDIINDLSDNIPDYKNTFAEKKPVIIMDAGIASEENLIAVHNLGFDYTAVSRSEHNPIRKQIDEKDLVEFKNASGLNVNIKSCSNQIKYKEKDPEQEKNINKTIDETLLYVHTQEKKQKEDSMINKKREKFEAELSHLQKMTGNSKKPKSTKEVYEKIGRLKERYKSVHFCYKIDVLSDENNNVKAINWSYIPDNKKEQESGSYFIRTTITQKNDQDLWHIYHKITEIEHIFRILKSELKSRPIYHQQDQHIESHLFMCIIALQVVLFIKHKLRAKGINFCWEEIIRIMKTQTYNINTVERRDGANVIIRTCTRAGIKAKLIYEALGYRQVPFYRKIAIVNNELNQ